MAMLSRLWLLAPATGLCVVDAALTLRGQPEEYWAGDYSAAIEGNPFIHPLLAKGPHVFVGSVAGWIVLLALVVSVFRQPIVGWIAVLAAASHAVGGASWLAQVGPWGLLLACLYIAFAAALSQR